MSAQGVAEVGLSPVERCQLGGVAAAELGRAHWSKKCWAFRHRDAAGPISVEIA